MRAPQLRRAAAIAGAAAATRRMHAAASPVHGAAAPAASAAATEPCSRRGEPVDGGRLATAPATAPAAPRHREYHSADFPWVELAPAGRAWEARHAHVDRAAEAEALAAAAATHWQRFHRRHATGAFFRPRHYVPRAFPSLLALGPRAHVLELGAGNGSNATLLDALPPDAVVHFSDVAGAALAAVAAHPLVAAGVAASRATVFAWDVVTGATPAGLLPSPPSPPPPPRGAHAAGGDSSGDSSSTSSSSSGGRGRYARQLAQWCAPPPAQLAGGMAATLCMFVLSALHPRHHGAALRHALATLRPGGELLFRDYGLYDLAQLRADEDALLTPRLHARGDGTLAYYFSVEELAALLEAAGFVVDEVAYVTIRARNRKLGVAMDRVWVHARATRPPAG